MDIRNEVEMPQRLDYVRDNRLSAKLADVLVGNSLRPAARWNVCENRFSPWFVWNAVGSECRFSSGNVEPGVKVDQAVPSVCAVSRLSRRQFSNRSRASLK